MNRSATRPAGISTRPLASLLLVVAGTVAAAAALRDQEGAGSAWATRDTEALCTQVAAIRSGALNLADTSTAIKCGTPMLLQVQQARDWTPERAALAKLLGRRTQAWSLLTPSGHFRLHFDTDGPNAVSPADTDHDGVPDWVALIAAVADSVWDLEVGQLQYRPPPSDQGAGGGDECDVYIVQLGTVYGWTYPGPGITTSSSYIEIDNDYLDPLYVQTRGQAALRVTLAHEFFHAVQFGYYEGVDGSWWQEATATWMEDVAYPEIDDYLQYLPFFLGYPGRALDSGIPYSSEDPFQYGACLFPHLLAERWRPELIRQIWEGFAAHQAANLDLLDDALRPGLSRGLDEALEMFARWNYYTGTRYREGYYREGARYPLVPTRQLRTNAGVPVADSGRVAHTGSVYVRLDPGLRPGGVTLDLDLGAGTWSPQVLVDSTEGVTVLKPVAGLLQLPGWDRYTEVVVAMTSQSRFGSGYPWAVTAVYDPELVDQPAPVLARLNQVFPNPFRPSAQAQAWVSFALSQPCASATLSVFAVDGTVVRRMELGALPARAQQVAWDGRDQDGHLVASGVYYCVLQAGALRAARTLSVVR